MKKIAALFLFSLLIGSCQDKQPSIQNVITSDIDHFWMAFDKVQAATDTIEQAKYLKELFFDKGSPGLAGIMQAKNYTPKEYLDAINNYPKFWASVRENTFKSKTLGKELAIGIDKLKAVYPELRPAKIYFTIGALRTNGTTIDSLVLIGSEVAMGDKNTVTSEFPEQIQAGRRQYFDANPIDNLVLLNVHEYVHTQQHPIVHNLLSQCLYEGVAEFVSVTAMDVPSSTPAINFGKENQERVRDQFEAEMFKGNNTYDWLWSDANNEFKMRDLGYYVGYEICERYYNSVANKQQALKEMIELDYANEPAIEAFVDGTGFFTATLEELYQSYEAKRPKVVAIKPFENGSQKVSSKTSQITVEFSHTMDQNTRNFDYGPLGEEAVVRFKKLVGYAEDGKAITFEIQKLEPSKQYQLTIGSGFRDENGMPLKPYLIDFKTLP